MDLDPRKQPVVDEPGQVELADLEYALHNVEPAAVLAPPRILHRVIKEDGQLQLFGLRVPHRKSYVIARARLLAIVAPSELDLPPDTDLAETVLLLTRPTEEELANCTESEIYTKYWRLLFHARVHQELEQQIADGRLDEEGAKQRISRIGQLEFDEVEAVLRHEDLLIPPHTPLCAYVEFAAVYLELQYFVESFLECYFPAILDRSKVEAVLGTDIGSAELFEATRLLASMEKPWPGNDVAREKPAASESSSEVVDHQSDRQYHRLLAGAARARSLGNQVRAATLCVRAAGHRGGEAAERALHAGQADADGIAERLRAALSLSEIDAADWALALRDLLPRASRGLWSAEARLLYDLQKVCVDHERGVFGLDLIRWAVSLGRTRLKRPLPRQRDVLMTKHLHSAQRRLLAVQLSGDARKRLAMLLDAALRQSEAILRERLRPGIYAAFDSVDMPPQDLPERVARDKLTEELLDRTVERGFLSMGDLRDALSRNDFKLPDLESVGQLAHGDELLQIDGQLAGELDGVYRRGEIYLRIPQRLSSLGFGTAKGRFFTQFVALPFGGAFVILNGLNHLVAKVASLMSPAKNEAGVTAEIAAAGVTPAAVVPTDLVPSDVPTPVNATMEVPVPEVHGPELTGWAFWITMVVLGFFMMGIFHRPKFRRVCSQALSYLGKAFRWVFYDLPRSLARIPIVQRIVASRAFWLARRYVFKPAMFTALLLMVGMVGFGMQLTPRNVFLVFLPVNILLNTRIGRNVDELISDWIAHAWHRFRINVVAALFHLIMDAFSRLVETIERLLYAVDEWLRFRSGEAAITTMVKAVLGVAWSIVHYVIRFVVNLLIEPQINPIKHFPVVTVSHKIILPLMPYLANLLDPVFGTAWALPIATATVFLVPGIFGFLVWELKENWRLYAANRPSHLAPQRIGHHGEVLHQLMRPGFRSGTLPKIYARLRRASRRRMWTGNWKASRKQIDRLHHVELSLRRFVDREFATLLKKSHGWDRDSISTGTIKLASNRILIEIDAPLESRENLCLSFADRSGWLVAGIHRAGWLHDLTTLQRTTLENALAGLYKLAGVQFVREQLDSRFGTTDTKYRFLEDGVLVTQLDNGRTGSAVLYQPPRAESSDAAKHQEVDQALWAFATTPVAWEDWVKTWELDQVDVRHVGHTGAIPVLPTVAAST